MELSVMDPRLKPFAHPPQSPRRTGKSNTIVSILARLKSGNAIARVSFTKQAGKIVRSSPLLASKLFLSFLISLVFVS
jgi:hypothetical protein